ncbi:MAG: hypothetical protein M0Z70_05110 [Nitrospiraceae bacterium]|jgi:hypothetical protein|nr:hypothetical protein [Nitrospirota bacterium]MDA8338662.1 hypothetical protein [Nitrospiraceae bacterium]
MEPKITEKDLDKLLNEDIKLVASITKQSRLVIKKEDELEDIIPVNTYTIPKAVMFIKSQRL